MNAGYFRGILMRILLDVKVWNREKSLDSMSIPIKMLIFILLEVYIRYGFMKMNIVIISGKDQYLYTKIF